MRRLLLLVAMLSAYAFGSQLFAQDSAKFAKATPTPAVAEKKAPPAEVTIPADVTLKLRDAAQQAALKQKEAENLILRIQLAQVELEKLKTEASRLQADANAVYSAAAVKAGVPASDVGEYEGTTNDKGEMVLKRKAPPAPKK